MTGKVWTSETGRIILSIRVSGLHHPTRTYSEDLLMASLMFKPTWASGTSLAPLPRGKLGRRGRRDPRPGSHPHRGLAIPAGLRVRNRTSKCSSEHHLRCLGPLGPPCGPAAGSLGPFGGSGLAGFSFTDVPLAQPGAPGLPLRRQDHGSFLSLPGPAPPAPGPLRLQTVLAVPRGWPRAFPASRSRNQQGPQSSTRARALAPGPHASP